MGGRIVLVAMLLCGGAVAQAQAALARGTLLLATERTHDTGFAETVVLLLQHDGTRSVGLVVNRRLGEPVATLFPDLRNAPAGNGPLWAGGPVAIGINALVRAALRPTGSAAVVPGVYLVSDRQEIQRLARKGDPMRIYVGLSSWGPRQLGDEMARGLWRSMPGSAAVVFDPRPETLWERLTKRASQSRVTSSSK
jgi:putative transcriptional regulator